MKLYYSPGSCSMLPHIVLRELGYDFEIEKVDLKTKKTETGKDFNAIHDKGYVPFLVLDNGDTLSEGVAIVQYLADQKPEKKLAPENGTIKRAHLQEWLNFISTELHKGFTPLFRAEEYGKQAVDFHKNSKLPSVFKYVNAHLTDKSYLLGNDFSVADAYLFTALGWANPTGVDLSPYPALLAFQKRVAERPKVLETMKAEGLLDQKAA